MLVLTKAGLREFTARGRKKDISEIANKRKKTFDNAHIDVMLVVIVDLLS